MDKFLEGQTALITGASRGLGRGIAQELAALGALVAINYANNEKAAHETLALVEEVGGEGFIIQSELGSFEAAEKLFAAFDAEMEKRTGGNRLNILINNAGGGPAADIVTTTPAILERIVADNMTSAFYVTKLALPRLQNDGRIINMSSKAAQQAMSQFIVYSMCKSAIETFTVALARDLGPRGITVNCISPGLIASDSNADIRANPELLESFEKQIALGRIGLPSDLSGVVKSLVSSDMGFVTGQVIEVSGGLFL